MKCLHVLRSLTAFGAGDASICPRCPCFPRETLGAYFLRPGWPSAGLFEIYFTQGPSDRQANTLTTTPPRYPDIFWQNIFLKLDSTHLFTFWSSLITLHSSIFPFFVHSSSFFFLLPSPCHESLYLVFPVLLCPLLFLHCTIPTIDWQLVLAHLYSFSSIYWPEMIK